MEGFLFKKARGESTFGRHNWKLRWFTLESTSLSYYENFSSGSTKPQDVKGIFHTDACTIKDITHPEFIYAFCLEHPGRKPLLLAAETPNLKKLWVKAIEESSVLKPGERPGVMDPAKYLDTLGIDKGKEEAGRGRALSQLTDEELESAFKFKAVKATHDVDPTSETNLAVEQVHEAYNILKKLKAWHISDKSTVMVHYSATVMKGPPG